MIHDAGYMMMRNPNIEIPGPDQTYTGSGRPKLSTISNNQNPNLGILGILVHLRYFYLLTDS
jgi:hypothetical protein